MLHRSIVFCRHFVLVVFAVVPAVQAQVDGEGKFQKLVQQAREAQQAKDYARAAQIYREIVTLRPRDPTANQNLGLAFYLQNNHKDAIHFLRKALALDPQLGSAALYLGISYYRTNQFTLAAEKLKKAQRLSPKDPTARYWLGASHLALEDFPAAISELESAREAAPKDMEVLYLLARAYAKFSASLMDRLLQMGPGSASAHRLRAEDFVAQGLPQGAIQELDRALQLNPRLPGLHLAKGEIFWQEKRVEEALAEMHQELLNDPPNPETHYRLGALYLANNKISEAFSHLDFAAKHRPRDAGLQKLLREAKEKSSSLEAGAGKSLSPAQSWPAPKSSNEIKFPQLAAALRHYSRGDFALAASVLKPFLIQHPKVLEARRLLIRCYLADEKLGIAVAELRKTLGQQPDDAESLYALGKAYEALFSGVVEQMFALNPNSPRVRSLRGEAYETGYRHEYEKALEEYRKALEFEPDLPGSQFAVGRVLWKIQRFEEAIPYLRKELERNPHHGLANYHLGSIYLSQGENESAISFLEAAIRAQPGLTEAHFDLGRALAGAGKYDLAIQAFQKVIQNRPEDAGVYGLMASAYRALGKESEARQALETFRERSAKKRQAPQ